MLFFLSTGSTFQIDNPIKTRMTLFDLNDLRLLKDHRDGFSLFRLYLKKRIIFSLWFVIIECRRDFTGRDMVFQLAHSMENNRKGAKLAKIGGLLPFVRAGQASWIHFLDRGFAKRSKVEPQTPICSKILDRDVFDADWRRHQRFNVEISPLFCPKCRHEAIIKALSP
jgi:hypothetical protein